MKKAILFLVLSGCAVIASISRCKTPNIPPNNESATADPNANYPLSYIKAECKEAQIGAAIAPASEDLLEMEWEGQARGEIEAGHTLVYRKATLAKGSNVTFHIDCEQTFTVFQIILTNLETGKHLERSITGKGELSFVMDEDGEYLVSMKNCSEKGSYFTMEYRISNEIITR